MPDLRSPPGVRGGEERIERWRSDLKVVEHDVQMLLVWRQVFRGMQDMLDEQASPQRWAISEFVDKHIARRDPDALPIRLTWGDLDEALCTLGQLVVRYHRLLNGSAMYLLTPALSDDWRAVFREPPAVRDDYDEHILEAEWNEDP